MTGRSSRLAESPDSGLNDSIRWVLARTMAAILVLDGVLPFELSVPGQIFGTVKETAGREH